MAAPASAVRQFVEALAAWARDEPKRVGERATENVGAVLHELGLVTKSEYDELELRVAQLEHRLRLVESAVDAGAHAPGPAPADSPPGMSH